MDLCRKENGFVSKIISKEDLNKPRGEQNVHHGKDEVGEEMMVDLRQLPSQAASITEPGLEVVSDRLRDHCNLCGSHLNIKEEEFKRSHSPHRLS